MIAVFEVTVSTHDLVKAGVLDVERRTVAVSADNPTAACLLAMQLACAREVRTGPRRTAAAMPTDVSWSHDLGDRT